jgi:uncharacterized protein
MQQERLVSYMEPRRPSLRHEARELLKTLGHAASAGACVVRAYVYPFAQAVPSPQRIIAATLVA